MSARWEGPAEAEVTQLLSVNPTAAVSTIADTDATGTELTDIALVNGEITNGTVDSRQLCGRRADAFISGAAAQALENIVVSAPRGLQPLQLTAAELMAPLEPERYLLPGLVPTEAYTLIAGALSSYKSTLLIYLCLWRATGFDLLGLEGPHGAGCDIGHVLLAFYEDSDGRLCRRIRRIVQHSHEGLCRVHGARTAAQFLERVESNFHRLPLTGRAEATIVCRESFSGVVVPNSRMLRSIELAARKITADGLMLGIDPLRLAIVGSQNDDDGADVVVHTLNNLSVMLPHSGLVIPSHTNKAEAKEPADGYTGAAYATSGSALYSQHARSNFMMARLKPEQAKQYRTGLSDAQLNQQPVARLTHGRLSHGIESGERVFVMEGGVLRPVERQAEQDAAAQLANFMPVLGAALEKITTQGLMASKAAIEADPGVHQYGKQKEVRRLLTLVEENGMVTFDGSTRDRSCRLTAKGQLLATRIDGKAPEWH